MKSNDFSYFSRYTDEETFSKIRFFENIGEIWEHSVKEYRDEPAFSDEGKEYTYGEMDASVKLFRGYLLEKGFRKGDRLGILLPNSAAFATAFFAMESLGITAAILPVQLDEKTLTGVSMMFGLKGTVSAGPLAEKLGMASHAIPGYQVLDAAGTGAPAPCCGDVSGEDDAVIMFTGGTTGRSKGALLTHANMVAGTVFSQLEVKYVFRERYILCLPLSHVFGLVRNLMASVYSGSLLFFCKNNKDLFRDIAVFRPTILVAVPALVEMAINLSKMFGKNMFGPDLKMIICGAAWVAPYLIDACAQLGVDLYPGYGLTESSNLVCGNPTPKDKPEAVGVPYPGQELKIENGELLLKGINIFKEYVGSPEANAEAFTEDGWFRTGDLARFDEEGYLYITGRAKEIIVLSNGENVSPAEVEAKFDELVIVQDCQLFEDADGDGPHFLHLEVVPRQTELKKIQAEDPNAYLLEQLRQVAASLPAFQRPNRYTIRTSDFERTPAMKIKRYKKF